ncbi:right-handed parallel beta-helix repeat-containing protein, partial [Fulvivirga sp. RKSG066]|uniref:right-handed parallel beta-helix repeat-containing protein n=1 Tax=Fulvivirga aurantia TaxID=2529383 RepID=UPI0012BBFB34
MKSSHICFLILILFGCRSEDPDPTPIISELSGCRDIYAINTDIQALFSDYSCEYGEVFCEDCDYVLGHDQVILDNDQLNLPLGATVGIESGLRKSIIIRNFQGTAELPYIFTNCDGKSIVSDDVPAIKLHNNNHIRLTGTGSSDTYGINVIKGKPFGVVAELGTSNFEIDHLEITGITEVAISARTRPTCDGSTNRGTFEQKNSVIHHNYLHDVGGEGTYVGGSHWHSNFPPVDECLGLTLYEPELKGVKIYNNLVENVGKDGIQVGGAVEDCQIYNNIVVNYGLRNITVHQSGIQINPGTTGEVFSNVVQGGTGNG